MKTPTPPPAPTLTSTDLEELTGLTDRRHRQLAEAGHLPRPVNGTWPAKEVLTCLFRYFRTRSDEPERITTEKLRLTKAQADLAEFKQQVLKNEYVKVAEVDRVWGWLGASIASRIRSAGLPTKLMQDLLDQCADIPLQDYFTTTTTHEKETQPPAEPAPRSNAERPPQV